MRGWSVCLVGLYVSLQLFNWVTGLHWLADFSLPLSILGGLGLAIASAPTAIKATSDPGTSATTSNTPETPSPAQPSPPSTPESSISFTIHKNIRP